jgi:uncharacterized protein (TIGR00255 family)
MIRSMTGFGAADGDLAGWRVSVEVKTVNHRFLNPSIKLPAALARWEGDVREAIRRRITRGHVTLSARIGSDTENVARIDEARVSAYYRQVNDLRGRLGLTGTVDLDSVLRLPGVIASDESFTPPEDGGPLLATVNAALDALDGARMAEGARLKAFIEERLTVAEQAMARIAARAPARVVAQRDRLRESVRTLTEGIAVNEDRIAQEIALLADRLDVSEEIERFGVHMGAVRGLLAAPPAEGVGKRIGFLLQELLREANTTGSKANDAAMQTDVISIKEELERIREQVENLE